MVLYRSGFVKPEFLERVRAGIDVGVVGRVDLGGGSHGWFGIVGRFCH